MRRDVMKHEAWQRRLPAWVAGVFLAILTGCATSGGGGVSGGGIDGLHLFAVPVAVDLDQLPGPDGVALRVYASSGDRAKGVPIRKGILEILMYDGAIAEVAPGSQPQQPLRTWSFKADQLKPGSSGTLGQGYRFALRWETNAPTTGRVTVIARYTPPKGRPLYSPPSGISVTAK
jgi:hypothetical protein